MKLTKKIIDKFKYEGNETSQDIRWDNQLPGFGIRIYPTGRKSFVLAYRTNGRKHIMTVGQYGVLTLNQARDNAKEMLVKVNNGGDPLHDRKKSVRGKTINDLCEAYLERYAKLHKKTWRDDNRRINTHIISIWKNTPVNSIKREDIASLHNKIGRNAPYEANRTLALLSKIFDLAIRWGFLSESASNPARRIDKFKEEKRDRWVTPAELPQLTKAIDLEPNIHIRNALWLYLLTGVRKSELLNAKWEDIDFNRKELRLNNTKSGRVHYLPLSPAAVTLIQANPKLEGNPYLFPGALKGKPLVNISKSWLRIRKEAGVPDIRIHDLRRTVGSWLAQSGNSLHLIGKILNHSSVSTTQVYARLTEDNSRKALEAHSENILGIAGKQDLAKVVNLTKRRLSSVKKGKGNG